MILLLFFQIITENKMPKGEAWIRFLFINVAFVAQLFAMYYFVKLKEIKDNWALYRCNPMYMPLSDNIVRDFIYCVQGIQTNFIGYLLQPINYILSGLGDISSGFTTDIGNVRGFFHYLRMQFLGIFGGIFYTFSSIAVEVERMIMSVKDIVAKVVGIVTVIMYMVDGSLKTAESSWNGPPGQTVRAIGSCFRPDTKIRLQNGNIVEIQNVQLGDVLESGTRVRAVMKVDNSTNEDLYMFPGQGVDGEDVCVTGSHHVFDEYSKRFIQVKNHKDAVKVVNTEEKIPLWFSCLITNSHKIHIGNMIFWDWEDYLLG